MTYLQKLSKMFRVREDQAEELMVSERAAKLALSRRTLMGAGAALVTGAAFGFYKKMDYLPWNDPNKLYVALETKYGEYSRQSITRSADSWSVMGDRANSLVSVKFPPVNMEPSTVTGVSIYNANNRRIAHGNLNIMCKVGRGVTLNLDQIEVKYESCPEFKTELVVPRIAWSHV